MYVEVAFFELFVALYRGVNDAEKRPNEGSKQLLLNPLAAGEGCGFSTPLEMGHVGDNVDPGALSNSTASSFSPENPNLGHTFRCGTCP